jgi:hypothetical protein
MALFFRGHLDGREMPCCDRQSVAVLTAHRDPLSGRREYGRDVYLRHEYIVDGCIVAVYVLLGVNPSSIVDEVAAAVRARAERSSRCTPTTNV